MKNIRIGLIGLVGLIVLAGTVQVIRADDQPTQYSCQLNYTLSNGTGSWATSTATQGQCAAFCAQYAQTVTAGGGTPGVCLFAGAEISYGNQ